MYIYIYICKSLTINMGIYQGGITNHPFRGFKPHFPSGVQRGLAYMTSCLIYLDGKKPWVSTFNRGFPLSIHRLLSFLAAGHAQLQRLRSSCSGLNIPWNSSLDGAQRGLAYMTSCQLMFAVKYAGIAVNQFQDGATLGMASLDFITLVLQTARIPQCI